MQKINFRSAGVALFMGSVASALIPGCGGPSRAYAPNATSARDALDAALSTWQKGGTAEQLATGTPQVHVVDYQWRTRQVLEGYELLEEQPGAGEAEKRYSVLLKLKKPLGEKRVQYMIVGNGPIWVFRDEDYAKTSDMGEDPRPKRPTRGGR